ncbi:MAG: putative membrane protein insertion efficiency factor [Cryomorphaceae bacterium]|jgi:putative membrane protein insertion efficiency factor
MNPLHFPKWVIKKTIVLYQKLINPILHFIGGPYAGCRFSPSCSNYCLQAVEAHGAFRGLLYGLWRICRCHPWGGSGDDPVPDKHPKK